MVDTIQPEETKTPAHELLQKFIKDNNIIIDFVKPNTRQIEGGALLIDPPQIIVSYGPTKPTNS